MSLVRGTSRASNERVPESALCTVAANGEANCGCGMMYGVAEPVSELCAHIMPSQLSCEGLPRPLLLGMLEEEPGQEMQLAEGKVQTS